MRSIKIQDYTAQIVGEAEWIDGVGFIGNETDDGREWFRIESPYSGQSEFTTLSGIRRCLTSQNADYVGHPVNGIKDAVIYDSTCRADGRGRISGYITYDRRTA